MSKEKLALLEKFFAIRHMNPRAEIPLSYAHSNAMQLRSDAGTSVVRIPEDRRVFQDFC
jgi:hypothetical protein